jgi:hypothetical protein
MMPSLPNELWWKILHHAISLESNLAMINPSSERFHPFFPGRFYGFRDTHFYYSQLNTWKHSNMVAYNFVQVNRLWRGIAEQFLYSVLYVERQWRVRRFIDTVKLNPNLAKQLRILVIMPLVIASDVTQPSFDSLNEQVMSLCHGIVAIVVGSSNILSSPLRLFQSLDSSRPLLLLSALHLRNEDFSTFMINLNNYTSLQVLELSINTINSHRFPSFPEHITFPSLRALVLGNLFPEAPILNVIGKWELPSLKELSLVQWCPPAITPLLPLIQRSYEKLELLHICLDLLHTRAFHDIIQAPPLHLKNVTLNMATSLFSSPPMHPVTEPFFGHVVTLGITNFCMIMPEYVPAWVRFISDPKYMPNLRSVLTHLPKDFFVGCLRNDSPLMDSFRSFQKALEDRDVAFKCAMGYHSSFVPIKLLQRDILEVSVSLFSNTSMLIS